MIAMIVGAAPVAGSEALIAGLAKECQLVVAADAAGEWCISAGVVPDIAVGDFDSARPGAEKRLRGAGVRVLRFPAEKDESDLDLAVAAAREAGATRLVFSACTSARLDHTLAALGTVAANADLHPTVREPHLTAWAVTSTDDGCLALTLPAGTTVSVIAIGEASGVTLDGFMYPLADATLDPLSSRGISNVTTGDSSTVRVGSGTLLVVASGDL